MAVEPVVLLSALEHHMYCPRQCALIHVDGVWQENPHTVRGSFGHKRVDTDRPRVERGVRMLRGIPLWSEKLGLSGRADAVEVHPDGTLMPVEYKIGTPHGRAAAVQLCAQALCLEEMMGAPISAGAIWYGGRRRRHHVVFDEDLRLLTLNTIDEVRATLTSSELPPAVDDRRCDECQLLGHCIPNVSGHPERVERYVRLKVLSCGS